MNISRIDDRLVALGAASAGKLHWFDSIGSTNDYLLQVEPAFHAVVCMAGEQTAGRGRRGRHWTSSSGQGIYLSMGWRLGGAEPGGLSLVCGLSVLAALTESGVTGLSLKWPNDVLLENAKLAGILVEMSGGRCVIGIGLNVTLPAESARDRDRNVPGAALPATGLAEHGFHIDAELLAANLIVHLNRDLERFCREGFAPFFDAWNDAHAYHGAVVDILGGHAHSGQPVTGRVEGVDAGGALRLRTERGQQTFHAGEVSLRASRLPGNGD